ncbi:MAG: hypothetical protein Q8942_16985, partial [Bacillota bacterium]|nr:hypothetical protein [Bacillota bacterium]
SIKISQLTCKLEMDKMKIYYVRIMGFDLKLYQGYMNKKSSISSANRISWRRHKNKRLSNSRKPLIC